MMEVSSKWLSRLHRVDNALAYGIHGRDGSILSRSWDARLPEALLSDIFQRLVAIAVTVVPDQEAPEVMRWQFESHHTVGVRRADGAMFLIICRNETDAQHPDIQRLQAEFRGLRE